MLPAPTLAAVVEAAHAGGLPVVVHAEGPGTVAAAVRAPAPTCSRTRRGPSALDDGLLRDAAGAG